MAVATPTMLPVPMVADSAVVSAPNWLMSPGASGSFVTDSLMAVGSLRWMNLVRNVRYRCEPSKSTIIGGPHTNASMSPINWMMSTPRPSLLVMPNTDARKRVDAETDSEGERSRFGVGTFAR